MTIYKGFYIEETPTGFNVYSSYEAWRDGMSPVRVSASLDEAYGSADALAQEALQPRTYTDEELADIAKIFYETTGQITATTYTPTGPLYGRWENLTQSQRDQATEGLRVRIEREGLLGYLERKHLAAGEALTDALIANLRLKGYM